MEDAMMKSFEVINIQIINKCRGQGYDGASVMSGVYNGLQKRICERELNAVYDVYVHCAAHNLNLVLIKMQFAFNRFRYFLIIYNFIHFLVQV